jgi:beta-glucuronidase
MTQWQPVLARRGEPAGTAVRRVDGFPVVFQYGQPVPSFDVRAEVPGERDYLDLDQGWRFAFDPDDAGTSEGWMLPGFDDGRWQVVEVPLPWDLYDTPGFGSYDGSRYGTGTAFRDGYAWYRAGFDAPGAWSERFVKIGFLGVNYAASVYVNGMLVAEHEGGHTPFALDASAAVRPGAGNLLAVRVYRRPWYRPGATGPEAISCDTELPPKPVDYWPYAGITRGVFIEAAAQVTVSKLVTDARHGRLAAAAVVFNHGAGPARRRLILEPGPGTGGEPVIREVALGPGEVGVVTADLPIPGARPWSPADPRLYRLTARLQADGTPSGGGADQDGGAGDSLAVRYGMRAVRVIRGRLCLNGEPVFLKGPNWHEETPGRGRSMRRQDYDQILDTAAGGSGARSAARPRPPW